MKVEDILGGRTRRSHRGPRAKRIHGLSLSPIELRAEAEAEKAEAERASNADENPAEDRQ